MYFAGVKNWFRFRRYYTQIFLFCIVTVWISVILTSFLIYTTTSNELKQKVQSANLDLLEQIKRQVDNQLRSVERSIFDMIRHPLLQVNYWKGDELDIYAIWETIKFLNTLKLSSDAHMVDFYMPGQNLVISTYNGYKLTENYDPLAKSASAVNEWREGQDSQYVTYVKSLPYFSNEALGYIYIHLNKRAIFRILTVSNPDTLGEILILNSKGDFFYDQHQGQKTSPKWVEQLLARTEISGYFTDDDQRLSITFTKSDYSDWIIVSKISLNELKTYQMRTTVTILMICIFGVVVGGLLVYLIASKLYSPMRKLMREKRNGLKQGAGFENEWDWIFSKFNHYESDLKKAFMMQLIYGHYAYENENLIISRFKHFKIPTDCRSVVIVIEPEDFEQSQKFKQEDRQLVLTAVSSIVDDILNHHYIDYVSLRAHEESALIIVLQISLNLESYKIEDLIHQAAETIRMSIQTYLKFPSSIGVGRIYNSPDKIHLSFKEAMEALEYRMLRGANSIIRYDDICTDRVVEYEYPFQIESALIDRLRHGSYAEVNRQFELYVQWISEKRYDIHETILSFEILYHSLLLLLRGESEEDFNRLLEKNGYDLISTSKTIFQIEKLFKDIILPFAFDRLQQMQKTKRERAVSMAKDLIGEAMDEELSLTYVAEKVGLSAPYFSKIFKSEVGKSFVQYVSSVKVQKAMDLLRETNDSIDLIAKKVGYTDRTFRRVFKEVSGITPAQYRIANHKD